MWRGQYSVYRGYGGQPGQQPYQGWVRAHSVRVGVGGVCGGDNTQCTEVTGVNQDSNLTRGELGLTVWGGVCGGDNTQCTEVTGVNQDRNLTRGELGLTVWGWGWGGGYVEGTILSVQRSRGSNRTATLQGVSQGFKGTWVKGSSDLLWLYIVCCLFVR